MFGNIKQLIKQVKFGIFYQKAFDSLCGKHPIYYPWHFQWHFTKDTHQWQKKHFTRLYGNVLDVGCGDKPYENWLNTSQVTRYIGIDVVSSIKVDVQIQPNEMWPFEGNYFDCVIMTQSLEHFEDVEHVLLEVNRVLKKEGLLLITVPFVYPLHGVPHDFRRYTIFGLEKLLSKNFSMIDLCGKGKIGSVLSTLLLTNIENNLNYNFITRLLKGVLLPFWLLFCLCINLLGQLLNFFDYSLSHYCNTCLLARKRSADV